MTNPTAAMLVIGDEILSGRTRDANMHHLAQELTRVGIDLREVRIVGDDGPAIVAAVNALRADWDHVFTSGGIGPTHDDITADQIARAFGVGIAVRDDARAILATRYAAQGAELNEFPVANGTDPEGATLIENPVSGAPGFVLGNVQVMAGVPSVFQAMVASVLATLTGGTPLISRAIRIERPESDIAGPLAALAAAYPDLSLGSYPFIQQGRYGANIVCRGTSEERIEAALARLAADFPGATR